jgi:hypothetical protein
VNRLLFARIQARASAIEEIARNVRLARVQRLLDATFWPRVFGGCHTSRDTEATLTDSGFAIDARERFTFRPTLLATPVAPRILGRARR